VDPLHPIGPGTPPLPSRRVAPVDRLKRVSREQDRPRREPFDDRREGEDAGGGEGEEPGDTGGGHIDIRV
jgi:hypothetical protein